MNDRKVSKDLLVIGLIAVSWLSHVQCVASEVFEWTAPDGSHSYSDYPKNARAVRIQSNENGDTNARRSQRVPPRSAPIRKLAFELAHKYGVDPSLVLGIIHVESRFDTRAISPAGALGLMQLMPATAEQYGADDPYDPQQNIEAGIRFLQHLLDSYEGNVVLALSAYNCGPATVRQYDQRIPPYSETMLYVPAVLAAADVFRKSE
jgi:soluble lytic murein transglycosylase-like protein